MDTQPNEAVANDADAPVDAANPEDVFTKLAEETFGVTDEQEPAEGEEETPAEEADDELDIEEEADDLPPIDPPVSWDAEAKERFAKLSREDQEYLAKREGERERFLQSKSQEATRARQDAISQATAELAQIEQGYAQAYQQFAASFEVAEPDPMLQVSDPVAYAQQMRAVQQAHAQRSRAQQAARQHAQQAQAYAEQAEQAEQAQQHRLIVEAFPEYADPTTGPELQRKLSAVAKRIGYTDELISQARATDIIAMREVASALDKADKYDALMAKKMEKVRAAKGKPPVTARPGVAQTTEQARSRNKSALADTLMTSKNRDVQGAAFYELAKANGWVS